MRARMRKYRTNNNDAIVTLGAVKSHHSYYFSHRMTWREWLKELATFLTMILACIMWGLLIIILSA